MTQVAAAVDRESRGPGSSPRVGSGFFVGPERVLLLTHTSGRGKTSGLELGQIQTNNAALFHVRNGKVARLVVYWDRERALTELWRESYEGWAGLVTPPPTQTAQPPATPRRDRDRRGCATSCRRETRRLSLMAYRPGRRCSVRVPPPVRAKARGH
jgi:hypothetical protein